MIANIPTPQRNNNKVQGEFYPLQKQELIAMRKAKLINNTAFVHLALRYENPFCDRPVQIIPKEFALSWNIPESSIYKAIAQMKKLGLILIKSGKLLIEWISKSEKKIPEPDTIISSETKLSDPRKNSQIRQKILRSENQLSDPAKNSQIRENRSPDTLPELNPDSPQTLQTIQTSSYVSDLETHKKEKVLQIKDPWIEEKEEDGQGTINELNLTEEIITDEIANSIKQQEEEFFRSCSAKEINNIQSERTILPEVVSARTTPAIQDKSDKTLSRTQSVNWKWLPEGAWNINGKLDPAFQEWLAKKWLAKYDDLADIYEAKANVLAYFHNDPQKLPIRWEQYQEEFLSKAENIKTRLDHECKIKDKEKKDFLDRLSALKPLDESQSVSANQPIQASNLVLNQYQKLAQADKKESVNINSNQQNTDVKIVIDENDVIVETKQSSANTYSDVQDEYGCQVRHQDYTGCHTKEQIPVNKNAINAIADWLKAKKGGRK